MDDIRRILFSLMMFFLLVLLAFILLVPGRTTRAQELPDRPDTPQNLRVTTGNGVATVKWDPVEGVSLYRLLLKVDGGLDGSKLVKTLWAPEPGAPSTSLVIPREFVVPGVPVRLNLTALWRDPAAASLPATLEFVPPEGLFDSSSRDAARSGPGRRRGEAQDGIPIGAMGWIFRRDDTLTVYEAVSPTEGVLALRLTQAELDALRISRSGAGTVKVSDNRRVAVFLLADQDLVISMGPNPEGKILHTRLMGGLHGPVTGTWTTYDTRPPGEGKQVLPRLA